MVDAERDDAGRNDFEEKTPAPTATDSALLDEVAVGSVLDIGCGLGSHLHRLTWATRRVGLEPAEDTLARARALFPGIEFVQGRAHALPFPDGAFDSVICIDVIEHVPSPRDLLGEAARVLKPEGKLFLQSPNYPAKRLYDVWHWIRGRRRSPKDDPTHVSPLSARALARLVRAEGFDLLVLKPRNVPFEKLFPWIRRASRGWLWPLIAQKTIVVAVRHEAHGEKGGVLARSDGSHEV